MVKHYLSDISKSTKRTSDKFEEWCRKRGRKPSDYDFDAYDKLVTMVKNSPETSITKSLAFKISKTIGSSYRFRFDEVIKHDMSSFKIYLSCKDPTVDLDVLLDNAVYELRVGGQTIKKGRMQQGMDLIGSQFMPFGYGAFYHTFDLVVEVTNNIEITRKAEIEIEVEAVIDAHVLTDDIKDYIRENQIRVPWKYYNMNNQIETEILVFGQGLSGMLAFYY